METALQKLGKVITFSIKERNWKLARVANRCKCSIGDLQDMMAGKLLPTTDQWRAFCEGIDRRLSAHHPLFLLARKENEDKLSLHNTVKASITTNLGDKMRNVVNFPSASQPSADSPPVKLMENPVNLTIVKDEPIPPVVNEQKRVVRTGVNLPELRKERISFAKGILLQRPHININGPDGLIALVRDRFGIGLSFDILSELRAAVQMEKSPTVPSIQAPATRAPIVQPVKGAAQVDKTTCSETQIQEMLNDAAQLILSEIPNLQSFNLTVSENGEVDIGYTVREVKISTMSGSIKVKR